MINSTVPRYRTIKDCLIEIKQLDKDSCITEFFIRNLCKQNKVKCYLSGKKSLVCLDSLLEYLGFSKTDTKKE